VPRDQEPTLSELDIPSLQAIALAIDIAAGSDDVSHHDLPIAALQTLDDETVSADLRRAVASTFYRVLQLDGDDPARVTVSVSHDLPAGHSDEELLLWRALSTALKHPMPKSLVHDLLFLRRDGNVGQHAHEAIRLYRLTAITETVSRHTRVYSALRALTLLRLTGSTGELAHMRQLLDDLVSQDLAEPMNQPGLTLPMVAAIVDIAKSDPASPNQTSQLLESILQRYGTPDHIDYIAGLFRLADDVSDDRKAAVRRARVTTRLDRARSENITELKLFRLEEAARGARQLGYSDLYDESVADLQQIDTQAMNWVEISSELEYPPEVVTSYIRSFTFHGDWWRGLRQWLATDSPSGRYRDNEAVANESLKGAVLQQLFPRIKIGTHGLPERKASGDEALESTIRNTEYHRAIVQGYLLLRALKEVGKLAGDVSERELSSLIIERYRCSAANATILAKALMLFWSSEYLVSAYFVTPFIEAGARTLLLTLNEPIYRVEVGKTKGQYAPLSALLHRLQDEDFDTDWIRYLQTLTLGEGQNYRNDIAHGFLRQMDEVVATLLLRASALFLIMPETATADELRQIARRSAPHRPRRSALRRVREAASAAWRAYREP